MRSESNGPWVGQTVFMVFRTIHWDKAGETSSDHSAILEIADLTTAETALLVTANGIPVTVPVENLFAIDSAPSDSSRPAWRCGLELLRNFHPAKGEVHVTLRWMSNAETEVACRNLAGTE